MISILLLMLGVFFFGEEETPIEPMVKDQFRRRELSELMNEDRRGHYAIARRSEVRESPWAMPEHKPVLFKGIRHGSNEAPDWD